MKDKRIFEEIVNDTVTWKDITPGGHIQASGNSAEFNTGDWRVDVPVWNSEKCRQCLLCFPICPDSSIPVVEKKRLDFNLNHCKGCGVCAAVCPFDAIHMIADEK